MHNEDAPSSIFKYCTIEIERQFDIGTLHEATLVHVTKQYFENNGNTIKSAALPNILRSLF